MGLAPAVAVSLAIAAIPGWLLLRRLWPGAPLLLNLALGAGLGTGLAGTVYVIALCITDSTTASFGATEIVLIAAAVGLARFKNVSWDDVPELRTDTTGRSFLLAAGLLAILCIVFLSASNTYAVESRDSSWHMKARFIYRSEEQPLERIFNPSRADSDPEQLLLLPAILVRGWLYARTESSMVPIAISGLLALSTVLTLTGTLRSLGGSGQASLAGCILLGTPVFLRSSLFAPTEIAFGFFITAAIAILCIHDLRRGNKGNLPLLSGIAAGFAAATRSEGLLFVIVLCLSRLLLPASKASDDSRRHVVWIAAGAAPGIAATLLLRYIVPALGFGNRVSEGPVSERLLSLDFQLNILGGIPWQIVTFGAVGLVPLIGLHLITSRRHLPRETTLSLLRAGLPIGSLFLGDYIYRLAGPYSLATDLSPKFPALLLAAWPTALLIYSICVSTPPAVEESIETNRMGRAALIVGLVLLFAFGLESGRQRWNRPELTVSRNEVTAGTDSYVLRIQGMEGVLAFVRYTLDDGPILEFPARLDAAGEIRFEVEATTPRGRYHFVEFREDGTEDWIPADTYITVK